ncbi:hypothetical protein BGZ92_007898 [Podila epicladia]|nr:hypothetical protein BGZ92_007898 [Podila epicladia]
MPGFDTTWVWSNETRQDLIKRIQHVPIKPKLRVYMNYNNVIYCVAGEAAANVAGVSLEQLVCNKIFRPLGFLTDRFIELDPLNDAVEKNAAAGDMYSNVLDLAS